MLQNLQQRKPPQAFCYAPYVMFMDVDVMTTHFNLLRPQLLSGVSCQGELPRRDARAQSLSLMGRDADYAEHSVTVQYSLVCCLRADAQ